VAVAGAHAVAAGVAAADDDHVLAVGAQLALELVAGVDLVLLRQELHREVHAVELAARHRQVADCSEPPVSSTASNSACSCSG
jgi:hypothetical protein